MLPEDGRRPKHVGAVKCFSVCFKILFKCICWSFLVNLFIPVEIFKINLHSVTCLYDSKLCHHSGF
jgi:hypothetical protein